MTQNSLIFLKLGGSLITDKTQALTPRLETIRRISVEIAQARQEDPGCKILIGHGSGSFGHAIASRYQTQLGGQGEHFWLGFAHVWQAARKLNQIVIDTLTSSGLPVIAFPPSASVIANHHTIQKWEMHPIKLALAHDLIPIVQGDVVFDTEIGGTILSTEQIFQFLADELQPQKILLAGLDQGVYRNPEHPQEIIPHITPAILDEVLPVISGAKTADVTGGMLEKVKLMLALVEQIPTLKIQILSGATPGNIRKALLGETFGTLITI